MINVLVYIVKIKNKTKKAHNIMPTLLPYFYNFSPGSQSTITRLALALCNIANYVHTRPFAFI